MARLTDADVDAWLKVPLGKLGTERMVPIDDDTLALVDRLAHARAPGRPLPHPRAGRPTESFCYGMVSGPLRRGSATNSGEPPPPPACAR